VLDNQVYVVVNSLLDTRYQRKTGIPRVEYEVAKYLVARGAQAVAWQGRRFISIDFDAFIDLGDKSQALDLDAICDEPTVPTTMPRLGFALARLLEPVARRAPRWMRLSSALDRLLAGDWPKLSADERREFSQTLGFSRNFERLAHFLDALVARRGGGPRPVSLNNKAEFRRDAVMVMLGIWWSDRPFRAVEELKTSHGLRFVSMIYDLLPIRRPEFFGSPPFSATFRKHIDHVIRLSDAVCAISKSTAGDVTAYAAETGVTIRPVKPIPLCSDMKQSTTPVHSKRLRETGLQPNGFVLFVSTVNPRKNHWFAYQLWRRAVETMGDQVPTLVFAGQSDGGRGFRLISQDTMMWQRKLLFIEGPMDGEVAWLYENCAFTLFPSWSEGWGLPITESLAYGKYCLAGDNSSQPEAGQGLAFHADVFDGAAWLAELRRLITEPGYREAANARVREGFVARSWNDVSADVHDAVKAVVASPTIETARKSAGSADIRPSIAPA